MKLAAFAALALFCAPAWSSLLETENFNYSPAQSLNGLNGGTGWSGAWQTPGGLDATTSAGLSFGSLSVSGGAVSTTGNQPPNQGSSVATFIRTLGTAIGNDNTTAYVSFLMRPDAGFGFYGGLNLGGIYVGRSGNQSSYGLEGPLNDLSLSSLAVTQGQTVFFILRFDFLSGSDTVSLFLDPVPGQPEPGTASAVKSNVDAGSVSNVVINNYGGYTIDEIRIGSTYADVTPLAPTPAPEPCFGLGVGLLLLLGVLARRGTIRQYSSDSECTVGHSSQSRAQAGRPFAFRPASTRRPAAAAQVGRVLESYRRFSAQRRTRRAFCIPKSPTSSTSS